VAHMIVVILILRTCSSRPCYCSDEEKKGSIAFPHSYPHLLQVATYVYVFVQSMSHPYSHCGYGCCRYDEGNLKKAKFYYEAAAMAGHEEARYNLANVEGNAGYVERAVKHWTIAASAGHYTAMHHLRICFEQGHVCRESIDSTLTAYNNSCAEMRSEARDTYMREMETSLM